MSLSGQTHGLLSFVSQRAVSFELDRCFDAVKGHFGVGIPLNHVSVKLGVLAFQNRQIVRFTELERRDSHST